MMALHRVGAWAVLVLAVLLLTTCGKQEGPDPQTPRQAEAQRQAQQQSDLQAEKAQRLHAEDAARAAEASRNAWITILCAGGALACVCALLAGIHIGSRAAVRYRKEQHDT